MRSKRISCLAIALLLLGLASGVPRGVFPVIAQTSPSFNLEWHVVGGGGRPISSASFAVNSTAGQGAASPPYSMSASYVVSAGFWFPPGYAAYAPCVLRSE